MMLKCSQSLREILICFLIELHIKEGSHQNAVELDGLSMHWVHVLKSFKGLFLSNLKFLMVKRDLTNISDG